MTRGNNVKGALPRTDLTLNAALTTRHLRLHPGDFGALVNRTTIGLGLLFALATDYNATTLTATKATTLTIGILPRTHRAKRHMLRTHRIRLRSHLTDTNTLNRGIGSSLLAIGRHRPRGLFPLALLKKKGRIVGGRTIDLDLFRRNTSFLHLTGAARMLHLGLAHRRRFVPRGTGTRVRRRIGRFVGRDTTLITQLPQRARPSGRDALSRVQLFPGLGERDDEEEAVTTMPPNGRWRLSGLYRLRANASHEWSLL